MKGMVSIIKKIIPYILIVFGCIIIAIASFQRLTTIVVSPENTWVLNQTSDAQITMITCTPIGTYTHRLIVKGVLVEV